MSKRPLVFVLTLLVGWLAVVVGAQKPEPVPLPAFLESGTGAAKIGARLLSLPFARTSAGLLVGLEPLASELGGTLEETAKGRGYTLSLGEATYVFGIDSSQMVTGQKLVPLSQRPVILGETLLIPLDLLEKTFGAAGFSFAWDAGRHELSVEQASAGSEVEMVAEVVHLQGTTTLVLRFPTAVRYRVTETPSVLEVRLTGASFSASSFAPRVEDPLVTALKLQPDRLRIELAPGTAHERYELAGPPFRLVFDLRPQEPGIADTPGFVPTTTAPTRRRGVRTIVLDPGHGGVETGALGKGGAVEKELTLLLARELKARLEAALPVRVLLTRSEDVLVPLRSRTALANENRADLLVSIHLNSSLGGTPHGAETYFLSLKASDRQAELSANLENEVGEAVPEEGDEDLSLILWDLAQSKHLAESQRLATFIQAELNQALGLKDRGVKQAPFVVLMGATMPAVLIEFGFLSNPEEEAKLQDVTYRGELADAAVRAIARFRDLVEGVEPSAESAAAPAEPGASPAPPPPAVEPP